MPKRDRLTGRHYLTDDERLISLPVWMRRFLNGAEYYLLRVDASQQEAGNEGD